MLVAGGVLSMLIAVRMKLLLRTRHRYGHDRKIDRSRDPQGQLLWISELFYSDGVKFGLAESTSAAVAATLA